MWVGVVVKEYGSVCGHGEVGVPSNHDVHT